MEIKELNYLIAIAEEKSISKAADRLYMAQSSLSQFLQTLESSLDSKLFVRTLQRCPLNGSWNYHVKICLCDTGRISQNSG